MDRQLLVYPLLVLAGGSCYGILAAIVKLAYAEGFTFADVVVSQYFSGWIILGVCAIVFAALKKKSSVAIPKRRPENFLRRILLMLLTGAATCSVCLFYYLSLETTPASIGVVLLFQFVWIDVILESIAKRRLPSKTSLIAVGILFSVRPLRAE